MTQNDLSFTAGYEIITSCFAKLREPMSSKRLNLERYIY